MITVIGVIVTVGPTSSLVGAGRTLGNSNEPPGLIGTIVVEGPLIRT
jgi:hypothetical protein